MTPKGDAVAKRRFPPSPANLEKMEAASVAELALMVASVEGG